MIRDTSAQDIRIATTPDASSRRRPLLIGGAALALVLLLGWGVAGWLGGSRADTTAIA